MDLRKLQNGSDIRGVAVEGIASEPVTLTEKEVALFARGFLTFIRNKTGKKDIRIAIGHDSRVSADRLRNAAVEALKEDGAYVLDCGLSSTPSMFMATIFEDYRCDASIMLTASHLPFNRNGMKFFDRDGGLNKEDIKALIEYAIAENFETLPGGEVKKAALLETYSAYLVDLIRKQVNNQEHYDTPLKGMHIIVDAGNGAGGFYATQVLQPLGADTTGSQFLEPDGMFPNHIPNPEDKDAMHSICEAVKANHADLGIIFDTDVDRSSAVDGQGREISRNAIVALAAALASEHHPHTTIVTDSVTSDELHDFLENVLEVKHLRFKRGYKNVINEAIRLNNEGIDAQLAIETSGHAALKENYFLDDGAYLATKIIIRAAKMHQEGRTLDELIKDLKHPLEEKELRFRILCEDFQSYGDNVLKALKEYGDAHEEFQLAPDNHEGLRFSFDEEHGNGWCLLRKSLHDPILPMNVESNTEGGCLVIIKQMETFLRQFDQLDFTAIDKLK